MMNHAENIESKVRISNYFSKSVRFLDPSDIQTAGEYLILRNIYGRLIEYDNEGKIVLGIPSAMRWTSDSVEFDFDNKVKTIDGHVISAQDAELSLKRLIVKGRSSHGDIRRFLCPDFVLKNVSEECPGIKTAGNKLILTVVDKNQLPMLVSALESADYSIIPRSSLDLDSESLTILDYRNTSGPYFVSKDSVDGHFVLSANPNHDHYSKDMPAIIEHIPVVGNSGIERFLRGEVDILPTVQVFSGPHAEDVLDSAKFNVHETLPIRIMLVKFSQRGLVDFSPAQRLYVGKILGSALQTVFPQFKARTTSQFFQALSEGTLNEDQLAEINQFRSMSAIPAFARPMEFRVHSAFYEKFKSELLNIAEIEVIKDDSYNSQGDVDFGFTDTAWTENLNLIAYNLGNGRFAISGFDSEKWFRNYLSITSKAERLVLLNQLHFDLLKNVSFYPVEVSSYFAVSTKKWNLNQSQTSPGTKIWCLRRN